MTKGGTNSGRPVDSPVAWRMAGQLLKAGQYERVAKILHDVEVDHERAGNAILARTLAVAHRICLACRQCQDEVEWHRRAGEGADQREQELKQQLYTILDLIDGGEIPAAREALSALPTADLGPPKREAPASAERPSLWQRLQSLLGRGLLARSPERELPGVSTEALAPPPVRKKGGQSPPSLVVYCLGPFRVYQDDQLIICWPSGKGKAVFKYMLANCGLSAPKDTLMDLFWRDANPEAARNNLNVAIYGLRQALRTVRLDFPHILFQDDRYLLNPAMAVWIDIEEFEQRYEAGLSLERRGKLAEAVREYEVAEGLYQGDFLEEDLYEDWPMPQREGLKDDYLVILDRLSRYYLEEKRYAACIHLCHKILARDDCREDAHRRLMRCYSRQGQRNLALRQYHLCAETLARVLDVPSMHETVALYHQIRRGEAV